MGVWGRRSAAAKRLDFIDELRAVAVLCVFLTHCADCLFPMATRGGWIFALQHDLNLGRSGVVLFFAVSGFLIPSSLHGTPAQGSIQFIVRRFFRLYPVFWLTMLPTVATYVWLFGGSVATHDVANNLTMVPRWLGSPMINGAYWTLELELIFYAIILCLFLAGVIRNQVVMACLMIGGLAVFESSQRPWFGGALTPQLSADTFYLCLHLSCMFWGAMCRHLWDEGRLEPLPAILFATFTGYWLIVRPLFDVWLWRAGGEVNFRLLAGYSPAFAVFLLAMLQKLRFGAVMGWLGRISYSFYLLHGCAIYLLLWFLQEHPHMRSARLEIYIILAFAMATAFAAASFKLVEAPSIELGKALMRGLPALAGRLAKLAAGGTPLAPADRPQSRAGKWFATSATMPASSFGIHKQVPQLGGLARQVQRQTG